MFLLSNFLQAVAQVLYIALYLYMWVVIIRALISWVSPDPYNPIVQFLYRVTEPVLAPIRERMPSLGGIDFSPLVVLLVILFLQYFLVASLRDVAASLR